MQTFSSEQISLLLLTLGAALLSSSPAGWGFIAAAAILTITTPVAHHVPAFMAGNTTPRR